MSAVLAPDASSDCAEAMDGSAVPVSRSSRASDDSTGTVDNNDVAGPNLSVE